MSAREGVGRKWTARATVWMATVTAALLPLATTMALPGETGRVAFTRGGLVWSCRSDGTGEARLTFVAVVDRWPRWSPEGNRIAVVRDGDLVLLLPTGALLRTLTTHGDVIAAPSWSPDGRWIVYVRGSGGIAVVDATLADSDGTLMELGPVKSVAWNPIDADQIAYTDGAAIYSVRPDGTGASEIVPADSEGRFHDELAWDPQADQVVFTSVGPDGSRIEGAGVSLDGASGFDFSPAWSRDGQEMLFSRDGILHGYRRLGFPGGANVRSLGISGEAPDAQPTRVAPVAVNDVVATLAATPVAIDVLANDSDPDGDPLTLTAVGTPGNGTATFAGGIVTHTPRAGFEGIDHFLYTISDVTGLTARAAVSVSVGDAPLPPPPVVTVTPSFLDFGEVPVNKTKDLVLTVTNNTAAPVALAESVPVTQDDPQPFDTAHLEGCARVPILDPGQSCTRRVRFWSVPGAGAASPATLTLMDRNTFGALATVPLFASVGPPDVGPNAPPILEDDLSAVAPGFTHILDALRNDSDPDDDLLRIVAVADPPHGTAGVVSCAVWPLNPNSDCLRYVPDAGYVGPDAIVYTVSDGRGGTASATYHLAVGNVVPNVVAITPSSGPTSGGQAVRITGSNFVYRSDVAFVCPSTIAPLTVTSLTDTEILATTSPAFPGLCDLRVRTLFGQSGQLANAYTYIFPGAAPVAQDGSATTDEDTPVTITLGATDPNGDPLTFAIVSGPSHGNLSALTGNQVTYTPSAGYDGPDAFTFKANDGQADSNVATVSITVVARLDPVVLNVTENIVVTDAPTLTPSVMLNVTEAVVVTDSPTVGIDPPPTVKIDQAQTQVDPTSSSPIQFTVVFSEPVTGFDASDVSFVGSTVGGTLTAAVTGSGDVYTVSVTGMSGAGTVVASIPAGAATDAAGNPSDASLSRDNTVQYQAAATTTTLTSSRNPSLTTGPPIFTAAVSSSITGVAPVGQVEFLANGIALGRSTLFERAGQYVAVLGGAGLGVAGSPHTITAQYLGDASHQASTSAPLQQVVQAGTYYVEDITGVPMPFAPVAFDDGGRIAGNLGPAEMPRAGVYDPVLGFRMLDDVSPFSQAADMNAAGTVVGRRGEDAATTSGFVDAGGVLQSIPSSVSATGVNGREQIAVNLENGGGAAIHQGTSITPLDIFEARAINDSGVVAGGRPGLDGQPEAVVWESGALVTLGRFGMASASATHVNNAGTMLIRTGDPLGNEASLRYGNGLVSASTAPAWDINDADVVVAGVSEVGVLVGSDWTTLETGSVAGMAVNNRSEIVASVSGQLRRWTPVPISTLVVSPVSGLEEDDVTLTATLTSKGAPAAGHPVAFSLNGVVVGSATTASDGVATLGGVPLSGPPYGIIPGGVRAAFGGSRTLGSSAATASLTVNPIDPADLAISVSPPAGVLAVGSNVTYTATLSNLGPNSAAFMRLTRAFPAGLQFVSWNAPGGACDIEMCEFNNVAAGTARTVTVVVRPTTPSPLTATFVVTGRRFDPVSANNSAAVTVDVPPTVTINQASGQQDPTSSSPIHFTVVFSEPVTGFAGSDVSFAGSTVSGTLTATVTGSGANYTAAVTGMAGVGTVAVSIPAGAAADSGGNPSRASTSTDRTVLYGVSVVYGSLQPSNGGNAAFVVSKAGGQVSGVLLYNRGSVSLTSARFTSLVISGQTATMEGFTSNGRLFVVTVYDGGSGPDRFRLWIEGVEQTAGGALSSGFVVVSPWGPDTRLKGWVDLHTHPMSNIAFGGKLFHGAPSVDSLMPAVQMPSDPQCRFDQRATGIAEALSQDGPTRGDPVQSRCGDFGRNAVIKAIEAVNGATTAPAGADGFPAFTYWPAWNDITHQKMWVDWMRRAHQYGQRVMVALSHNNRVLADLLGSGGPITGVKDDKASSALQIAEIKKLVADHSSFMAVARTPDELRSIVEGGRLAVVLGVELDKIGNRNIGAGVTQQMIDDDIRNLHDQGVRYVLPIHLIDNVFGDTAIYQDIYNLVNRKENGFFWSVGCAAPAQEVGFQSKSLPGFLNAIISALGVPVPPVPSSCAFGHVNIRTSGGLTPLGNYAIRAMMKRGMIVDIDHMSDRAANATLALANGVPSGGYPVMSGHSGIRSRNSKDNAENARTTAQLARIACLGGMFGLGSDGARAVDWTAQYARGYEVMRRAFAPNGLCPQASPLGTSFIGLGTDANSLVKTPRPPLLDAAPRFANIYNLANDDAPFGTLAMSTTGTKTWDYNGDGVAHYGMFVDFLRDVRTLPGTATVTGRQILDDQMMYGADYFYRMWLKADTQKSRVP